jgi:hypothetical protein
MTTERRLVVQINAYWITATGRGGAQDSATRVDRHGLPFLPGRHLRGLIRDAVTMLSQWDPSIGSDAATRLFGSWGRHSGNNREGVLEVRNATLPPRIAEPIRKEPRLRNALFEVIYATAIAPESGTAKNRSLRSMRVAVPMTLVGTIAWRDGTSGQPAPNRDWDSIEAALPYVMAVGAHRNRGLGAAVLWLE